MDARWCRREVVILFRRAAVATTTAGLREITSVADNTHWQSVDWRGYSPVIIVGGSGGSAVTGKGWVGGGRIIIIQRISITRGKEKKFAHKSRQFHRETRLANTRPYQPRARKQQPRPEEGKQIKNIIYLRMGERLCTWVHSQDTRRLFFGG